MIGSWLLCLCEESDTTERLHFHFSLSCIGEGNGNPFQYFCLENPRDGGAWWAAVYGVAQSWTRLKWLSSSSSSSSSMRPSSGVGQLKLVQPVSFEAEVFCAHVQNRRIRKCIDVNELITIINKGYWNLCTFNNINNYVYNQLKFLSYILSLAKNFFKCRLYSTFQLHKVYLILKECSLGFLSHP